MNFILIVLFFFISCTSNKKATEFVKITESEYDVILDIRYATKNNFTGKKIYKNPVAYLPKEVADKLKVATKYAKNLDIKLKFLIHLDL